jgi:CBS domain containing-hemolysin-like protein
MLDDLIITAVMLFLTAFFSGSETAVVSSSKVRLRHLARRGSWRARTLEGMLGSPEFFFSVVLVGTNLSVIICTAVATAVAVSLFEGAGALVSTIVMTPLLLVFGEVIPKSAFLYHADRVSIIVSPMLKLFSYVLWPVVMPVTLLARLILGLGGSRKERFNLLQSREELVYMYRRGKKRGAIEVWEDFMIDRILRFQKVTAGELMIAMDRVVSFPVTASVEEVIIEANKHSYSRFPLISPSSGRIVGVVSLFDLLGLDGGENLASVMHEPFFVGENDTAEELLVAMKEIAIHMAIVVNEEGDASGIVTLENILENIVGNIANEYE